MNNELKLNDLTIPLLNGLTSVESNHPSILKLATGSCIERLIILGEATKSLNELVDEEVKQSDIRIKEINKENKIKFLKDYNNGDIEFKIYVEDVIKESKVIRQFNAYFIDTETKSFYLLTLSNNWINYPTELLKLNEFNLETDEITKGLYNLFGIIISNLKHKNR